MSEAICRAIKEMGFVSPMPVQEEVIPYILNNTNDVIALAQTGTGKTAAYGIPILQRIDTDSKDVQALVLSPTRELCLQIADDMRDFSKYMPRLNIVAVYGGSSIETQIRSLRHGAQIIVATPGRLIDLMNRGKADLSHVKNVVLDEADRMLDMGFSESIDTIFEGVPKERGTLLFSATMSKEIEKIAMNYLHDHKEIVIGSRNEGAENVNHVYYLVNAKDKYLALKRIVDYYPRIFAILFCRTKIETQEIADKLIHDGYNAEALHGDLSQQQRDLAMQRFRDHKTQLLVATDVAARGLDVEDLTHVINYGMPDDIESYTHRSGRTGRAGKSGTSIAIIHTRERHKIRAVEKEIGKKFVEGTLPTPHEICTKQLYKAMDEIVKVDVNEEEIAPFMTEINRYFEYIDKEDIIKKMVSRAFGRFLAYYANAPEISPVNVKADRDRGRSSGEKGRTRGAQKGYRKLFINLGKNDGFYPGEIMQFLNKNIPGRQEVGHIELQDKCAFIEVPSRDAHRVMQALNGAYYGDREVRCNDAGEGRKASGGYGRRSADGRHSPDGRREDSRDGGKHERRGEKRHVAKEKGKTYGKEDWRQFFDNDKTKFKDEEPDFSEEGWAMRIPRKKKK